MKRILPILALVVFLFTSCDYESGVSDAFRKYRGEDGITTITVPGWVISLASHFGDLEDSERELLESIDKVRVLTVEDDDLNAQLNLHKEFYSAIKKEGDYEELLVVREKDEKVTIFGRIDDEVIKEMVVLVGGDDNVMVYVKGEISPELISDQMDLKDKEKLLSFNF